MEAKKVNKSSLCLMLAGIPGLIIQLFAVFIFFTGDRGEVLFFISFILYGLGTCFIIFPLENYLMEKNINPVFSLFSLLGFFGSVVLFFPGKSVRKKSHTAGNSDRRPVPHTVVFTIILSVLGVVCVIWSFMQRPPEETAMKPVVSPAVLQLNEIKAFLHIKRIYAAQAEYFQTDWDSDGLNEYASYLVHLWQTVNHEARPVRTRLIPKQLAFAMHDSHSLDGYIYVDLHARKTNPVNGTSDIEIQHYYGTDQLERINNENEWAMAIQPAVYGRTGKISFLVDSGSRIFCMDFEGRPLSWYPYAPEEEGWVQVQNHDDVVRYQARVVS